jgi:hypothetical protein
MHTSPDMGSVWEILEYTMKSKVVNFYLKKRGGKRFTS